MVQVVRNFIHGQMTFKDGAGRSLVAVLDEGNFSFEETKEAAVIMSRGKTSQFAEGVEQAIPITFSLHFTEYFSKDRNGVNVDDVSFRDFLSGDYAGAVSVTNCRPHQVTIELYMESPCDAGQGDKDETLIFTPAHVDKKSFAEEEESNKITFTAKSLRGVPNNNVPNRNVV